MTQERDNTKRKTDLVKIKTKSKKETRKIEISKKKLFSIVWTTGINTVFIVFLSLSSCVNQFCPLIQLILSRTTHCLD